MLWFAHKRCTLPVRYPTFGLQFRRPRFYGTLDKIIDRIDFHEVPPKVEYSLTPMGRSLVKILELMCIPKIIRVACRRPEKAVDEHRQTM